MLVADGFDELQFCNAAKAFQEAGWAIRVVAPRTGLVTGAFADRAGHSFLIDQAAASASARDYQALFLPGGERSVESLADDELSAALISDLIASDMAVGASGAGIRLLEGAAPENGEALTVSGRIVAAHSPALCREAAERVIGLAGR